MQVPYTAQGSLTVLTWKTSPKLLFSESITNKLKTRPLNELLRPVPRPQHKVNLKKKKNLSQGCPADPDPGSWRHGPLYDRVRDQERTLDHPLASLALALLSVVFSLDSFSRHRETFPGHFQDVFGSEKNERESAGNLGKPATTESVAHDQRSLGLQAQTRGRERERETERSAGWCGTRWL